MIGNWRNSKRDITISVPVKNGRYTVLLGGQGMNPLPPELFLDHNELYLKVRFNDGSGRDYNIDQQITATPRALVADLAQKARVADSVKPGTITTAQLNLYFDYFLSQITHPKKNLYTGQNLTLSGTAEGKFLTYQWNRNGKPIEGATSRNLHISI